MHTKIHITRSEAHKYEKYALTMPDRHKHEEYTTGLKANKEWLYPGIQHQQTCTSL